MKLYLVMAMRRPAFDASVIEPHKAFLDELRAQGRLLWLGVGGRLIAVPLVFLTLAAVLQFRDVQLATLIAVFASPTAVSSYPMAQQLGGDADFAASQVALTTAFSGITVFVWVFVFKALGCLR